jgi:hypothetical protein
MIIWQSTLTDEHAALINEGALQELIRELDQAVEEIVTNYVLEYPA